ncbi:uncharacterized protein LOC143294687 [Babylonia areolata]|uniref:uncharacterized protein LOC143294687 n=1 Tax=Babylonia areolata TaxID=304850 RepID=UPI003FD37ED9
MANGAPAMPWADFLTLMLESTQKVEKAAIFNAKGQPLATTEDLQVSESDGRALLNTLHDTAHCITRLTLDGVDFRCFQGNATALVGQAVTGERGRVMVARLTEEDVLVVVLGHSTGHGSFLYEVQHHLQERTRRRQQQLQQQQQQVSIRPGQEPPSAGAMPVTAQGSGPSDIWVQLQE